MPRLDRLSDAARTTLLTFPARASATAPFSTLGRPRAACRLALVTTAGLHRRGDRPFAPGDQSYRVIPSATPTAEIVQSHTSIGFDRAAIMRDVNVSFPIDRVRELVAAGELGGLAPSGYSFMGALRDGGHRAGVTGPAGARRHRDEGVDIALITPT